MEDEEIEALRALNGEIPSFSVAVQVFGNPWLAEEQRGRAYGEILEWRSEAAWSGAIITLVQEALERLPGHFAAYMREAMRTNRVFDGRVPAGPYHLSAAVHQAAVLLRWGAGHRSWIPHALSSLERYERDEAPALGAAPCPYDVWWRALSLADCPTGPQEQASDPHERLRQIAFEEPWRLGAFRDLLLTVLPRAARYSSFNERTLRNWLDPQWVAKYSKSSPSYWPIPQPVINRPGAAKFLESVKHWSRFAEGPRSRANAAVAVEAMTLFALSVARVDMARRNDIDDESDMKDVRLDADGTCLYARVIMAILVRIERFVR